MNSQFGSDEEVLARLVREAGDPSVSPDPQHAERLRATILDRLGSAETVAHVTEGTRKAHATAITVERTRRMKRIAKFAVAATLLVAVGFLLSWIVNGGGSTGIAFAEVAKALDSLRSATYEFTMEGKNPVDGTTITTNIKGFFLSPSRERMEMSISMGSVEGQGSSIMILDHQAMKCLVLVPEQKLATTMDSSKMKQPAGGRSDIFETVRRLVREGSTGPDEEVESLGRREIDGQIVVGFRTHNNMADMSLWADPQTARPVRIEVDLPDGGGHGVMSNFRYDVELDPELFRLEPPAGYTVEKTELKRPVEDDLVRLLRFVAEHNNNMFPATIGMNSKEYQQAMQMVSMAAVQKHMQKPETLRLLRELQAQYGEDRDGFMKAWMKAMAPINARLMEKSALEHTPGMTFYMMLTSANDSHYVGGGVKLGTPDRPIFWYKPTGADKYRVVYADLSVKEAAPAEVNDFPEASEDYTAPTTNVAAMLHDEKDLIEMLRVYAAQQNGLLPPTLSAHDVESGAKAPLEKHIEAKYGTSREAKMKAMQDDEFMKTYMGLGMTCARGLGFLGSLKPENDSHYAGKDVKLDTPDRPIFWYQPTGAEKYRVIYADLSVKELAPEDVEDLPEGRPKPQ